MLTIFRFVDLLIITYTSYFIYLIFFKFYKTVAFTFYINKQSLFTKVSLLGLFYSNAHNSMQWLAKVLISLELFGNFVTLH